MAQGTWQLAGSPAVANRPAEAARCFSHVRASERAFTIRICRGWGELSAHTTAHTDPRLARALRLAPTMLLDFSRMRGVGATCTAQTTHDVPNAGQPLNTARSAPFRQDGNSLLAATGRSGVRERIDGIGWPSATLCIDTRDPRVMFRGPGDRQAPIFRQKSEGELDSQGSSEAAGRRDRTALMSGHGTVGPSSWHAGSAIGRRLTALSWEQRML
jgi:hypothetical protein